eukprot:XP_017948742.1 PREDICTED: tubulin monoglycylase TTLL3-like [Xenopus tropicalis]
MWFDHQFKDYLQQIGATNAWDDIILPGMKEIIIQTMKSAQDKVEHRKNTFHLYGADFMFGENFQPWLIEINASPALSKATSVSSRLSAQVQEDILRVILDRKQDSECYVGDFELLYQQPVIKTIQAQRPDLLVKGTAIRKPHLLEKRYAARDTQPDIQKASVKPSIKVQVESLEGAKQCTKQIPETIQKAKDPVVPKKDLKLLNVNFDQAKIVRKEKVRDHSKERDNQRFTKLATEKPLKVKESVLHKERDFIDLKLPKLEPVQAKPKRKETKQLRDRSNERANESLYRLSNTKPVLEKPFKVNDTVKKLDDKEKLKQHPCIFCKGQICTCPKPKKPAFVSTGFPSDILKRPKVNK